jgi:hypothetical protein
MFRQPPAGSDDFPFHAVGSVPAVLRDKPPDGIQVFGC